MAIAPSATPALTPHACAFIQAHGWGTARQVFLPGDFSARHYIRLYDRDSFAPSSALLMVLPQGQSLQPFLRMAELLSSCSIAVPQVYAHDTAHGLALIEDFGDIRFDTRLDKGADHEALYSLAVDVLVALRETSGKKAIGDVPQFGAQLFLQQVTLFVDVYGAKVCGHDFGPQARAAFEKAWEEPLRQACEGPHCLMLRDYHAANIMIREGQEGLARAGIIDFQDGGVGPWPYDLASLLEDARRDVAPDLRKAMIARYLAAVPQVDKEIFMRHYAILAVQRHMRILAIVARRWLEDGMQDAEPYFRRTWQLMMAHQDEPYLAPVYAWLDRHVPSACRGAWRRP